MNDDEYRRRIYRAEEWAASRMRSAAAAAKASLLVPAHRRARYASLESYFVHELARPQLTRVERALDWILEAIEQDVYGLPRDPIPSDLSALVADGLVYVHDSSAAGSNREHERH